MFKDLNYIINSGQHTLLAPILLKINILNIKYVMFESLIFQVSFSFTFKSIQKTHEKKMIYLSGKFYTTYKNVL